MSVARSTFYWLWFVNFGVIALLVQFYQSRPWCTETLWLFFLGLGGIITDSRSITPYWSRPYDIIVGTLLLIIGWIGVLHNLGINLVNNNTFVSGNVLNSDNFLGLSLTIIYSLIHLTLGFFALKFGLRNPVLNSSLDVNTKEK